MIPSGHVRSIDPTYVKVLMVCRAVVTDEAICDITKSEYYVIRLSVSRPAVARKYHHHFYHLDRSRWSGLSSSRREHLAGKSYLISYKYLQQNMRRGPGCGASKKQSDF